MAPKVVNRPVYLDYAAATPVDPRVIEEMVNCLKIEGNFANSASRDHVYGWEALDKVENARSKVADLVGASPLEIYFTSGATESSNLAILGLAKGLFKKGDLRRHLITTKIEHKAVLESCRVLESEGYKEELEISVETPFTQSEFQNISLVSESPLTYSFLVEYENEKEDIEVENLRVNLTYENEQRIYTNDQNNLSIIKK